MPVLAYQANWVEQVNSCSALLLYAPMRYAVPMVTALADDPAYQRLTIAESLDMEFGSHKAELDDGYIRMIADETGVRTHDLSVRRAGSEKMRIVQRTGPQAWTDAWIDEDTGIAPPQFDLTIPR